MSEAGNTGADGWSGPFPTSETPSHCRGAKLARVTGIVRPDQTKPRETSEKGATKTLSLAHAFCPIDRVGDAILADAKVVLGP